MTIGEKTGPFFVTIVASSSEIDTPALLRDKRLKDKVVQDRMRLAAQRIASQSDMHAGAKSSCPSARNRKLFRHTIVVTASNSAGHALVPPNAPRRRRRTAAVAPG
jgi:hypothetical protein